MLRRLLLAVALLITALSAQAAEYTDVYYDPDEPNWGVFLVQSDTFQFLAFFIYGADGKPTWYTAQLTDDGTGKYAGRLYATTGTYFAAPWQATSPAVAAGAVTFQPSDAYHAQLTYIVDGVGTVTKPIQRQTLAPYVLAGNYSGSAAGSITGCTNASDNINPLRARFNLTVKQSGDASATLSLTFVDATYNGTCVLSGPLTHFGRLYQMANAQFGCTGTAFTPFATTATVESFHPTGQGIEGHWIAKGSTANGCTEIVHFSAVLN